MPVNEGVDTCGVLAGFNGLNAVEVVDIKDKRAILKGDGNPAINLSYISLRILTLKIALAKVSSLKLFCRVSSQSNNLVGSDFSTIPTKLVLYII